MEARTAGWAIALRPDSTAVERYEFLGEREADTCSLVLACRRSIDLSKAVENPFEVIDRDPDPRVGHFEFKAIRVKTSVNPNLPAAVGEL